jgi:hypothetical protein
MQNSLYSLAQHTRDHLRRTDFSNVFDFELAQSFANDLDWALNVTLPEQILEGHPVRGLYNAPLVLGKNVPDELTDLYGAARNAFGQVRWTEFYEEDSWSKPFISSFACGEGIGPDGRLQQDEMILGLFLLGPDTFYPEHAHPAEEYYIALTGNPEFKVGNNQFELQNDGAVILHHSNISHAIRSSKEPFYAIYGWRGEVEAKTWYRDNMNEETEFKKYPKINKR